MKTSKIVVLAATLLVIFAAHLHPCTIIMVGGKKLALAGNNEDHDDPFAKIWIIPASKNEFGRICFGFEHPAEGGMNDQGLFIDGNALSPETGWVTDPQKPSLPNLEGRNMLDLILAQCATVDDVLAFFQKYNVSSLRRGKFPVADRSGASAVIEWGKDGLRFNRKSAGFQISTNFVTSDFEEGSYPCNRYRLADALLRRAKQVDLSLVRHILSVTHGEGVRERNRATTIFSYICDLRNGVVTIYNYHDFENPVVFNLQEELKKGAMVYDLPSIFKVATNAHRDYLLRHVEEGMKALFKEKDSGLIAEKYRESIRKFQRLTPEEFKMEEVMINALGVQGLRERNEAAALAFFRIQADEYPSSSIAHECVGKAYIYANDRTRALESLNRALNLNPKNQNAQTVLSRLQIPEDLDLENQDKISPYSQIPGSYSFKELGTVTFYRCGGTLWLRASSNTQTPTRIHPLGPRSLTFQFNSEEAGRIEVQFLPNEQGQIKNCRLKLEKQKIDVLGDKI